jgi:hypothetical protein
MQTKYTCVVTHKQAGQWFLELKPVQKPAAPVSIKQRKAKEPIPLSLQQFIKANGGLDPEYNSGAWSGELRMVVDSGKHGVVPGLLSKKSKRTWEEMAELCCESGYFSEPDIDAMLFYLSKDIEATLTGQRNHRVYGYDGVEYQYAMDLERWESLLPEEAAA